MDRTLAIKKVKAYLKNPELIKEPSMGEMADLVVLVLTAVQQIEGAIKEHRLDGKTPVKDVEYLGKETALKLITKGLNDALAQVDNALASKSAEVDALVQESLQRIRDGNDGIVTEEEIQRAAEIALGLLELPDFDALVATHITSNGFAIRDALELLSGEDRYKVEIADVQGLAKALNELALIRSTGGGTIGKQQVYGFIRQAIADGTITTGGISDGDKGDITVSNSGATWTIDNGVVTEAKQLLADNTTNDFSTTKHGYVPKGTNTGKFLKDDGTWASIPGGGDMLASTYDPQAIGGDAFDADNHTDGTTNKVFTATEKTKLSGIETAADVTDAVNVGSSIHGATAKVTPVDADTMPLIDSAASNVLKKVTWANIKATLKTYLDTLYAPVLGADDNYVTDAEKVVIGNTSGVNTGDQTNITGNAATVTTNANLTGPVTSVGNATAIADGALSIAKTSGLQTALDAKQPLDSDLTTIAGLTATTDNFIVSVSSAWASRTPTQVRTTLNVEDGADVTDTTNVTAAGALMDSEVTDLVFVKALSDADVSTVNTGTSTTGVVTPDSLAGSYAGTKSLSVQLFDGTTDVTTGDGKAYITIPEALNGMNLVRAQATVVTAGTTNATTVMIHNKTDAADMLSGAISIASAGTVGTVGTINGSADDVATNDVLRIDVDSVSTTAPKGLMVVLEFRLA